MTLKRKALLRRLLLKLLDAVENFEEGYVGDTSRTIKTALKEHEWYTRLRNSTKSALVELHIGTGQKSHSTTYW
ncbi:unnamed protein product [Callosobruchus maculatus]|uniref:Uncharacterized protein n=1 Tax=Callosobruchus maculatus TaxID=64391 RepID=A0A653DPP0_CALMS|nr:unnamed protein product [Callosobruchus maculatus]